MARYIDAVRLRTRIDKLFDRRIISANAMATMKNIIDKQPTVTEAEIRNKAIDEFVEKLKECFRWDSMFNKYYAIGKIDKIAEQLKEE